MNEVTNYIFRHMRIADNNLKYLKRHADATEKCIKGLVVVNLLAFATLLIQDKQIKNLEKEVTELKSKGE